MEPASEVPESVLDAVRDDMNTPQAFAEIDSLKSDPAALAAAAQFLGLLTQSPQTWFQGGGREDGLTADAINGLIEERAEAKKAKNFGRADEIRDQLTEAGIVLEDGAGGTTWRRG